MLPPAIDWPAVALAATAGWEMFLYGVQALAGALREAQGGRFDRLLRRSAAPSGAALHVTGLSHLHVPAGRITAEWLPIDEVSIWERILAHEAGTS